MRRPFLRVIATAALGGGGCPGPGEKSPNSVARADKAGSIAQASAWLRPAPRNLRTLSFRPFAAGMLAVAVGVAVAVAIANGIGEVGDCYRTVAVAIIGGTTIGSTIMGAVLKPLEALLTRVFVLFFWRLQPRGVRRMRWRLAVGTP